MRKLWTLAVVGVFLSGLGLLKADEKGEKVTLKGDAVCAKCALKEAGQTKCQNVVLVKKDGETKKYYIVMDAVGKKAHSSLGICRASKEDPVKVKVVGTCEKKGDKLTVTATEIEKDAD